MTDDAVHEALERALATASTPGRQNSLLSLVLGLSKRLLRKEWRTSGHRYHLENVRTDVREWLDDEIMELDSPPASEHGEIGRLLERLVIHEYRHARYPDGFQTRGYREASVTYSLDAWRETIAFHSSHLEIELSGKSMNLYDDPLELSRECRARIDTTLSHKTLFCFIYVVALAGLNEWMDIGDRLPDY